MQQGFRTAFSAYWRRRGKSKAIGGFVGVALAAAYTFAQDIKRWPLMDTDIGREILVERQQHLGEGCDRRLARSILPGRRFDCRCFFNVLIDNQMPLRQLPASDKREAILKEAVAECADD
jgi:hypothetical protein